MKPPAVSVVMPVFNRQEFLREAAASILGQSFTDFELVIVDDGSTDGTLRLIDDIAAADRRVRVVRQENRGTAAARNLGIKEARGRYVAVMDSDDVAHPDRLGRTCAFLEDHADFVCAGTGTAYIDETGARLPGGWMPRESVTSDFSRMPPRVAQLSHSSTMIRAAVLRELGGYRSFSDLAHDLDLFLRLEERGKIHCVQDRLVRIRHHRRSLSSRNVRRQEEHAVFAILSAIIRRAGLDDPIGRVPDGEIDYFAFKAAGHGVADVNAYAELAELRSVAAMYRLGLPMSLGEWLRLVLRYRLNARNRHPKIAERMAQELARFRFDPGLRSRTLPAMKPSAIPSRSPAVLCQAWLSTLMQVLL